MSLTLHLAIIILLCGIGNARRIRYCAGLSEENPIEPHQRCAEACAKKMNCDYGYCRFFDNNPQPRCWCMDCKKKKKY